MHEHIGPSVDSTSPGQRGFASEILSRHGGGVRVENGIKYARGEGEQSVRVRACQVPGEVELVVADTGTGIAEDAVPSLFEPFHRGRTDGNGYGWVSPR